MKFSLIVNQKMAIALGITSISHAHIFDLFTGLSTWAEIVYVDGEPFYWISRRVICEQLPLLDMQEDTVYRHMKKLEALGLINYKKYQKKDLVNITKKGASYYFGNKSGKPVYNPEKEDDTTDGNSDLNPKTKENSLESEQYSGDSEQLGFESENNSDLNPTDKYITNIHTHNARDRNLIPDDFNLDGDAKTRLLSAGVSIDVGNFLLSEFVNKNISTGFVSRCWSAEFASYCKRNEWRYRKNEEGKRVSQHGFNQNASQRTASVLERIKNL